LRFAFEEGQLPISPHLVHWNWELVISRGGYLFFAAFFFAPFAFFAM
jgi:hypothetical protein